MAAELKTYIFVYIALVGVFGLLYTRKQPKTYWTSFPWFLIVVGIQDGLGLLINKTLAVAYPKLNFYYYQLFVIPFQVLYYFWLINRNIITNKRIYYIGSGVFILSVVIECFSSFKLQDYYFSSFSYMIANILMLVHIMRYFYQLSKSDRILFFYKERMFWVSLGLLIFWLGSLPFFGIFDYLFINYQTIGTIYYKVVIIFNYLMCTCFLISFIWAAKEK